MALVAWSPSGYQTASDSRYVQVPDDLAKLLDYLVKKAHTPAPDPSMFVTCCGHDGTPLVDEAGDRLLSRYSLSKHREVSLQKVFKSLVAYFGLEMYVDESQTGHPVCFREKAEKKK